MRKKTSLIFLTMYDEKGASSRHCIYQYFPYLEAAGFQLSVYPLITDRIYDMFESLSDPQFSWRSLSTVTKIAYLYIRRVAHIMEARKFDAAIVQKDVLPFGLGKVLGAIQKNIIFEFDDPIWLPHQGAGGTGLVGHTITAYRKHCLTQMLRRSRLVIVEDNPALEDYSRKHNRNVICQKTGIALPARLPVMGTPLNTTGWVGSPGTTHLLERMWPHLEELGRKIPLAFLNIGGKTLTSDYLHVKNIPWSEEAELTFVPQMTVGLMPSDDQAFQCHRISRKYFIYGAFGVPTLAPKLGLNTYLIEHEKNGLIYDPSRSDSLMYELGRILGDPILRKRLGEGARRDVEQNHNLPRVGEQFANTLIHWLTPRLAQAA